MQETNADLRGVLVFSRCDSCGSSKIVEVLFFSGDAQEVSEINPKRVGDYPADVGMLIEGLANTVSRLSGVVGFLTFIVGTGLALLRGNPLMAIPGALIAVGMMVLPKMVTALLVVQ